VLNAHRHEERLIAHQPAQHSFLPQARTWPK
jgi:hypothetical protein